MKTVSGKQFCKAPERKGWTLVRIKSSHHIYESPERSRTVSVPVHRNEDLKPGMQRALMRQSGLTDDDL